ncbi:hypothetical protein PM082_007622 [Marasmius tenuissimus]|nr:hypothetical protein PM082_007622 [Marasmius tenuissimus]
MTYILRTTINQREGASKETPIPNSPKIPTISTTPPPEGLHPDPCINHQTPPDIPRSCRHPPPNFHYSARYLAMTEIRPETSSKAVWTSFGAPDDYDAQIRSFGRAQSNSSPVGFDYTVLPDLLYGPLSFNVSNPLVTDKFGLLETEQLFRRPLCIQPWGTLMVKTREAQGTATLCQQVWQDHRMQEAPTGEYQAPLESLTGLNLPSKGEEESESPNAEDIYALLGSLEA